MLYILSYCFSPILIIYGNNTKSAVKAFQKSCGITADGICGKTTLLYLGLKITAPTATCPSYDSPLASALITFAKSSTSEFEYSVLLEDEPLERPR